MTNLKTVTEGMNKYCGPAVLSILTGKNTDECARAISRITGNYKVEGVYVQELLKAGKLLGVEAVEKQGMNGLSLFRTVTMIVHEDGMYIISTQTHFFCIEVNNKKVYFCDNHTKEPIPAASSARLMAKVITCHRVTKVQQVEPPKPIVKASYTVHYTYECNYCNGIGKFTDTIMHTETCEFKLGQKNG